MNRRQRIIISVTGIFIVLLALVGITYAYFLTRIQGNTNTNSISVTTANLKLVYTDGSPNVVETSIEPSDTEYTKTFTVKNEGNVNTEYGVYLIDVINTFELKDDIKYTMSCTTDGDMTNYPCGKVESETTFPSGISRISTATIEPNKIHTYTFTFTYKDSGENQSVDMNKKLQAKIQIFAKYKDGEYYPYEEGTLAYNMINRALNATGTATILDAPETTPAADISGVTSYKKTGEEATFAKSMSSVSSNASKTWYYYDAYVVDATTGKFTLSGKHSCTYNSTTTNTDGETVNCYDDMVNKYLYNTSASSNSNANNHTADTKTDLSNVYKVTSATATTLNYVTVFNSPNDAERVLATTSDDYGISYYYRGAVEDNYVNFAGMCWRIVRVAGDGSVKLLLEDRYTTCNDTEDTDGTGTTDYKYTGNWSDDKTYEFGYDSNYRADFLNYTGGLADSFKTFQTALAKKINTSLTDTSTQTEINTALSSKLKIDEWCYDDEVTSTNGSTEYYGAYTRIMTNSTPSLTCTGTKLTKFKDNTNMYVGTITADEIVFAGADKNYTSNYNYYLMNNYSKYGSKGLVFWSLSPIYFDGSVGYAFDLYGDGLLSGIDVDVNGSYVFDSYCSRPAVSLKSGSVITGGEGTLEKPYIIG